METKEYCIGVCEHTGKTVLMVFDLSQKENWLCLHKETREEELKEIEDFLKEFK